MDLPSVGQVRPDSDPKNMPEPRNAHIPILRWSSPVLPMFDRELHA
jgi:hypothetical protein